MNNSARCSFKQKRYVLYSNNTKYCGYFTGKRGAINTFRSKFGVRGVNYMVDMDVTKAKIYTTNLIQHIADNMNKKDFWKKSFRVIEVEHCWRK